MLHSQNITTHSQRNRHNLEAMTLSYSIETNSRTITLLTKTTHLQDPSYFLLASHILGDSNRVDAFSFYKQGWNLGEAWKHHAGNT